jgi:hypothetical protein
MQSLSPRVFLVFAVALGFVVSLGDVTSACQVPVFRFALERWAPNRYQAMVLCRGPLSAEVEGWLKPLRPGPGLMAPVELTIVDMETTQNPELQELWDQHRGDDSLPVLVVRYPKRFGASAPASVQPLSENSVRSVLDSPVRSEIVRRLTEGHSAVWVLLKSGDAVRDAKALERLESQLIRDAERLELPSAEELEVDDAVLGKAKIPLKINFSVVSLDRQNAAERFLIDSLMGSEPDLRDYPDQPIAFPVFGRGIVLYALVGDGISAEVVGAASKFIVGPCSCQVKEQNPGFDLLLNCDWDSIVGSTLISSPVPSVDSAPRLLTIPPGKAKN